MATSTAARRIAAAATAALLLLGGGGSGGGGGGGSASGALPRPVGAFTCGPAPASRRHRPAVATATAAAAAADASSSGAGSEAPPAPADPAAAAPAAFGQVVPLPQRRPLPPPPAGGVGGPSEPTAVAAAAPPASTLPSSTTAPAPAATAAAAAADSRRRRHLGVALASVALAAAQYAWRAAHPASALQLLTEMQAASPPLTVVGRNGRPTVVDFWAPWCETCRREAPTLYQVRRDFGDQVNFVLVNGDDPAAWGAIETFGVDAIPHLALVDPSGRVETALVGEVPRHVLEQDLRVLLERRSGSDGGGAGGGSRATTAEEAPLPYQMLDAFANRPPEARRVRFDDTP